MLLQLPLLCELRIVGLSLLKFMILSACVTPKIVLVFGIRATGKVSFVYSGPVIVMIAVVSIKAHVEWTHNINIHYDIRNSTKCILLFKTTLSARLPTNEIIMILI